MEKQEAIDIPSRAEMLRRIKRTWVSCGILAGLVFATTGGTVLSLFLTGHDTKRVVEVTTAIFQLITLAYALGFFVPGLLTSIRVMLLGVDMSRQGLEIGRQTADTLSAVQGEIKPIISDLKYVVDHAKPVVTALERALVDDGILAKVEAHMKAIRQAVDRDMKPLPAPRRPELEGDEVEPPPEPVDAESKALCGDFLGVHPD